MAKCDACGATVVPAAKQWIDRDTWEITDKDQLFYLDPEPHENGRFAILEIKKGVAHALYLPFNEENGHTTYITHASTCEKAAVDG